MVTWADADEVAEAAEFWTDAQLNCRLYQHNWRPLQVLHKPGVYTVVQRCVRCRNLREQDVDEYGYPVASWKITYRKGYLLEGLGRVGSDGKARLRLASFQNIEILEVSDD